jgi:autotransporter-associated beta strand protein
MPARLAGAAQTGSGYGYDITWMLPLQPAYFVSTDPMPAPTKSSVNQDVRADQVIGTPSLTGGEEAPTRLVFYFSGEAGESLVSNVGIQHPTFSSEVGAIVGSGGITKVGSGTLTLSGGFTYSDKTTINAGTLTLGDVVTYAAIMPTIDVSRNIGMIIGNGETRPAPSSFAGVVAFTGSSGTLLLDPSSGFTGTVAGMSGQDTIDFSDINFTTPQAPSYSGTNSGGTLTISDGSHTANIALIGNYLASTFVASSDGHGGTSVTQVPNQPLSSDSITSPKA